MENSRAADIFAALAQENRLKVFRLLVRAGPEGMAAGDIARRLKVPHNTLSAQLAILHRAGLVVSRRAGRSIIYGPDFAGVRKLMAYLLQDCCQGRPSTCAPLLDAVLPAA